MVLGHLANFISRKIERTEEPPWPSQLFALYNASSSVMQDNTRSKIRITLDIPTEEDEWIRIWDVLEECRHRIESAFPHHSHGSYLPVDLFPSPFRHVKQYFDPAVAGIYLNVYMGQILVYFAYSWAHERHHLFLNHSPKGLACLAAEKIGQIAAGLFGDAEWQQSVLLGRKALLIESITPLMIASLMVG